MKRLYLAAAVLCALLVASPAQADSRTRVLPGTFQPNWLSTSKLWLRADVGVTTGATFTWHDQSGNGYDSAQATALNQPTVVVGVSALPSLAFNAANEQILVNATIPAVAQSVVLYVVAQEASQATSRYPVSFGTNAATGVIRSNAATTIAADNNNFGNQIGGTYNMTNPFICSVVFNGASSSIRANGSVLQSGTLGSGGVGSGYTVGGESSNGADWWDKWVSEIILDSGTTQNAQIQNYLQARYGITP